MEQIQAMTYNPTFVAWSLQNNPTENQRLARKNNRFKGAIRIFVTPKNEGVNVILPESSLGMGGGVFFKCSFTLRAALRSTPKKIDTAQQSSKLPNSDKNVQVSDTTGAEESSRTWENKKKSKV